MKSYGRQYEVVFDSYLRLRELYAKYKPECPLELTRSLSGLLLETIDTPDLGKITVGLGDMEFPAYWDRVLELCNPDVKNSRPEYVLKVSDSYEAHVKSLSQVGRSLKYGKDIEHIWTPLYEMMPTFKTEIEACFLSAVNQWNEENSESEIQELSLSYLDCYIEYSKLWDTHTMISFIGGQLYAVSLFQHCPKYDELHWLNTLRLHDEQATKTRLGNNILLSALKKVYTSNLAQLNLGITHYDYKTIWKPEIQNRETP